MAEVSDVFTINENYPTADALLVPGPNQSSYTIFIYQYSDWLAGNQGTLYALAQSGVNSDGTWQGVLDPYQSTPGVPVYAPVQLPILTSDAAGNVAFLPFTVVAVSQTNTIVLALEVNPPAYVPPGPSSSFNESVFVDSISMSDDYWMAVDNNYPDWLLPLSVT